MMTKEQFEEKRKQNQMLTEKIASDYADLIQRYDDQARMVLEKVVSLHGDLLTLMAIQEEIFIEPKETVRIIEGKKKIKVADISTIVSHVKGVYNLIIAYNESNSLISAGFSPKKL